MNINEDGEIITPFLRTGYNYDMNEATTKTALFCMDKSLTQQQFKEESDINTIIERFGLNGELPKDLKPPQEGDFTEVVDYQTALNQVIAAEDAFMQMPAHVRERFGNNPQKFLEFTWNEDNRAEAEKMGLTTPKKAPPGPIEVRVMPGPQETQKTP